MPINIYFPELSSRGGSLANAAGKQVVVGSNSTNIWYTVADFGSGTTGLRIEAISGHNSAIYSYSNTHSTYTYNVAADTVRTFWTGSGIGGSKCRMVVWPSTRNGSSSAIILQVAATSQYTTSIMFYIASSSSNIQWTTAGFTGEGP